MRLSKEYANMNEMSRAFFEGVWAGQVCVFVVFVESDKARPPTLSISASGGMNDKDVADLRRVLGDARTVMRAIRKRRRDEKKAGVK